MHEKQCRDRLAHCKWNWKPSAMQCRSKGPLETEVRGAFVDNEILSSEKHWHQWKKRDRGRRDNTPESVPRNTEASYQLATDWWRLHWTDKQSFLDFLPRHLTTQQKEKMGKYRGGSESMAWPTRPGQSKGRYICSHRMLCMLCW